MEEVSGHVTLQSDHAGLSDILRPHVVCRGQGLHVDFQEVGSIKEISKELTEACLICWFSVARKQNVKAV